MSEMEKRILRSVIPESEPLPYPTKTLAMSIGPDTEEFVIPADDKAQVIRDLYPFATPPEINETMFDIHENKSFRVADFKVIREENRNYLVSPYYASSGGMVIDWVSEEQRKNDGAHFLLWLKRCKSVIGNHNLSSDGKIDCISSSYIPLILGDQGDYTGFVQNHVFLGKNLLPYGTIFALVILQKVFTKNGGTDIEQEKNIRA